MVVGALNKDLAANDKIVGMYSNASYTISTLDKNPVKAFMIVTTPDPITANANSAYGFDELFTEWPNTL